MRQIRSSQYLLWLLAIFAIGSTARADRAFDRDEWVKGPSSLSIGTVARIDIPAGYWGCNQRGSIDNFLRLTGNLADENILAIVIANPDQTGSDGRWWFLTLAYYSTGYVSDEEKGSLDGDTIGRMLDIFKQRELDANVTRRQQGLHGLRIVDWYAVPFFNDRTKNFTWATTIQSDQGERSVNYDSRLLGRAGVINASLVISPEHVDALVPVYENLMSRISFVQGHRYSEFKPGDKVAGYGLTALATGTTVAVAAKNWKGIVALGAAILAVLGGIVNWIKSKIRAMVGIPQAAPAAGTSTEAPQSDTATVILTCRECGQKNRVRAGQSSPLCGKCGAKIQ